MDESSLPDAVLNKGKWCAPFGNNHWAAGANYIWDTLNCKPTQEGKKEILEGLHSYIKHDYRVINHLAGIRPILKDQNPILGMHPQFPNLGIFNGLGSKGFLMAPYYAEKFTQFLINNIPIDQGVCISRFKNPH